MENALAPAGAAGVVLKKYKAQSTRPTHMLPSSIMPFNGFPRAYAVLILPNVHEVQAGGPRGPCPLTNKLD